MTVKTSLPLLSLSDVHHLMDVMCENTVNEWKARGGSDSRFPANPMINALQDLCVAATQAYEKVVLDGRQAFDEAFNSVIKKWEGWRSKLAENAGEVALSLCEKLMSIMSAQWEGALKLIPQCLPVENWENEIESISTEFSLNLSPSFELALHRCLTIACTGEIKVEVTYSKKD